ncbi:MAG: hypothetical protein Q7S59_03155 [Sulfurimonas sp.]|nr:hypothetical protein [Sulfurimonas sp.]
MSFKNWEQAAEYFSKKENILIWFGERDVNLYAEKTKGCLHLSKFKWVDGWLFYSVKGEHDGWEPISKTVPHHIDVCQTHRIDGSSIIEFEPYSSFRGTFKDIPDFHTREKAKKEEKERQWEEIFKNLKKVS